MWIDADTHIYQNGVGTMSLTVTVRERNDEPVKEGEIRETKKEYKVGRYCTV